MNRKIGKHISTTTTILGLLVLTNAVAHADVARGLQFKVCVNRLIQQHGMSGQKALAMCQQLFNSVPRQFVPHISPAPRQLPPPIPNFGRTPYNPPNSQSMCEYLLGQKLHGLSYSAYPQLAFSQKENAYRDYEECVRTTR